MLNRRVKILMKTLLAYSLSFLLACSLDEMRQSRVLGVPDGKTSGRTSSSGFVSRERATMDKTIATIRRNAAILSGVPEDNQEAPQILLYEPGQFYRRHYDTINEVR